MDAVPRAVDEVDVVRGHGGNSLGPGPVDQRTVLEPGHELGVDRERVAERCEKLPLGAQEHEPRGVLTHRARKRELGIEVPGRDDVTERAVALASSREEHRPRGRGFRLHQLRARDRPEPPLVADLPVEHESVERVRVGEREPVHPALARRVGQGLEALGPAHEGVVAMNVEMDEG